MTQTYRDKAEFFEIESRQLPGREQDYLDEVARNGYHQWWFPNPDRLNLNRLIPAIFTGERLHHGDVVRLFFGDQESPEAVTLLYYQSGDEFIRALPLGEDTDALVPDAFDGITWPSNYWDWPGMAGIKNSQEQGKTIPDLLDREISLTDLYLVNNGKNLVLPYRLGNRSATEGNNRLDLVHRGGRGERSDQVYYLVDMKKNATPNDFLDRLITSEYLKMGDDMWFWGFPPLPHNRIFGVPI